MEKKNQSQKKGELEKRIVIVKQAIIELRSDPKLIKKMENALSC